ncbi:helicase associated domain-containing protein [Embleya sp. NPDC059237]|uniref:helicase associated domain-containing protein n=1 Tax=Embleya sp. NPDC059237 TaxID=3346784 RepID=UPI0036820051
MGLDVAHRGTAIGRWVARQRSGWDDLNQAQREQLLALGLTPPAMLDTAAAEAGAAVPVPDGPRPRRTREQAWAIAVGAAAAYRARVGHVEVPRAHVETVTAFDGWPDDVRLRGVGDHDQEQASEALGRADHGAGRVGDAPAVSRGRPGRPTGWIGVTHDEPLYSLRIFEGAHRPPTGPNTAVGPVVSKDDAPGDGAGDAPRDG